MKTTLLNPLSLTATLHSVCRLALTVGIAAVQLSAAAAAGLVVHEWGTFTSVQGGDGELLPWRAAQVSELPAFVYDWTKPGLNRLAAPVMFAGKGGLVAFQRMETPVIYFYSDAPLTADVSVQFPKGMITEWFPQAAQVGPAVSIAELEDGTATNSAACYESLIRWRGVQILPAKENEKLASLMPIDARGSHYFAARETDAAFV